MFVFLKLKKGVTFCAKGSVMVLRKITYSKVSKHEIIFKMFKLGSELFSTAYHKVRRVFHNIYFMYWF